MHGPGSGIVLPEPLEARRVGAAEAIDRLVGIADDAKICRGRREQFQQAILLLVDILEFVDRDPSPAVAITRGESWILRQSADGKRDEIVEIDPAAHRERAAVGLATTLARAAMRALLLGDSAQEPLRLGRAETERLGDERGAFRLARHTKAAVGARRARVFAQDRKTERMEGVNCNLFDAIGK